MSRRTVGGGVAAACSAGLLIATLLVGQAAPSGARAPSVRALEAKRSSLASLAVRVPAAPAGPVARFTITVRDAVLEIAPGVRYRAWTFDGRAPGPVLHARQGQRVEITFRNAGTIPHSFDLHAARIPANRAFRDILPGHSLRFSFVARDPGVFLYHCVTSPAVMHIANGMFGALVVDPSRPLPAVQKQFVLVASEWYLDRSGQRAPAQLDLKKALAMTPDWATFNGFASQYVDRPLHVRPHEKVRFYVVNAGPNLVLPFHLVGGVFDRTYPEGDETHPLAGVQTSDVPPGGSAIFDAHFDQSGLYGFVSHTFASAEKGAEGDIAVGNARGTMTH